MKTPLFCYHFIDQEIERKQKLNAFQVTAWLTVTNPLSVHSFYKNIFLYDVIG